MVESLKELQEEQARQLFGTSRKEAIEKRICVDCKQPQCPEEMDPFDSREYNISGLCPDCWERIMDVGRRD